MRCTWLSMPIVDPRRQKNNPPGLRTRHVPCSYGLEVRVVAGKMEDGVADDHIRAGILERHLFDGFNSKIRVRERGRELAGERPDALDGVLVRVRGINLVPFPQEVDQVSTGSASRVQYSHSGCDAAFQQLVEKIDVDLAELFLERRHFNNASRAALRRQANDLN